MGEWQSRRLALFGSKRRLKILTQVPISAQLRRPSFLVGQPFFWVILILCHVAAPPAAHIYVTIIWLQEKKYRMKQVKLRTRKDGILFYVTESVCFGNEFGFVADLWRLIIHFKSLFRPFVRGKTCWAQTELEITESSVLFFIYIFIFITNSLFWLISYVITYHTF